MRSARLGNAFDHARSPVERESLKSGLRLFSAGINAIESDFLGDGANGNVDDDGGGRGGGGRRRVARVAAVVVLLPDTIDVRRRFGRKLAQDAADVLFTQISVSDARAHFLRLGKVFDEDENAGSGAI